MIQMCLSIVPGGGGTGFGVVACTVTDVTDDETNHCCYHGTVKTKHFGAPQLICGQLAVWSQSLTLSLMEWKKNFKL